VYVALASKPEIPVCVARMFATKDVFLVTIVYLNLCLNSWPKKNSDSGDGAVSNLCPLGFISLY
jgi:hypothetical protein